MFFGKNCISEVIGELEKTERKRRLEAAQLLVKSIREKISKRIKSLPGNPPGRLSGDLFKGVGFKDLEHATLVGACPPAHHAHLLEFGTKDRRTKKGPGSGPRGSGHVEPRPYVFPTFEEQQGAVGDILSRQWI